MRRLRHLTIAIAAGWLVAPAVGGGVLAQQADGDFWKTIDQDMNNDRQRVNTINKAKNEAWERAARQPPPPPITNDTAPAGASQTSRGATAQRANYPNGYIILKTEKLRTYYRFNDGFEVGLHVLDNGKCVRTDEFGIFGGYDCSWLLERTANQHR